MRDEIDKDDKRNRTPEKKSEKLDVHADTKKENRREYKLRGGKRWEESMRKEEKRGEERREEKTWEEEEAVRYFNSKLRDDTVLIIFLPLFIVLETETNKRKEKEMKLEERKNNEKQNEKDKESDKEIRKEKKKILQFK